MLASAPIFFKIAATPLRYASNCLSGGLAGVLGLNPDETGVAGRDTLPITGSGVVGPTGRNDEKRTVASETQLGQRAWEI